MKKQELVSALADASGASKAACERVLDALAPVATAALVAGKVVALPGLGKLKLKQLAARSMTTPQGQALDVPARAAAKFVPAKALKEVLGSDDAPEGVA